MMAELSETSMFRTVSLASILPNVPLLSSVPLGWSDITLEHFRYPPFETPEYTYADHKIAIHTRVPPNLHVKRRLDGRVQYEQVFTEQVIVVPATVTHQVQWDRPSEFLILTLKPEMLYRSAYDAIAPDRVDPIPCKPRPDPLMQQLGLALKAELELDGGSDRLYVESLVNCLTLHLLKKYSAVPLTITSPSAKLPQFALKQVIAYINDRLEQDLKLADLAALVGMSVCYFASRFKQSTGRSPHQFIVQRRLERSQQLLKQSNTAIAEIALQCGFSSQSHLTRQFRKHLGITPKSYRDTVK
jgi:AraC family transcriptional regulator